MVEVKGARLPMTSCNMPVAPEMRVQTDSPTVIRYRRAILRMLLSNYYDAGYKRYNGKFDIDQDNELIRFAKEYDVDVTSAMAKQPRYPVDSDPNPFVLGGSEQMHPVHPLCARLRRGPGTLCLVAVLPRLSGAHRGGRRLDHAGLPLRILRRVRGLLPNRRAGQ